MSQPDPTEQEVADLKRRAEQLSAAQQRLVAQAEAAEEDYERLLGKLRAEFGVSSVEEARALLEKVDAELSSEIASVRSALESAERPDGES